MRIERAEKALHNGDYVVAQKIFDTLSVENLEDSEAALARFGLAQSLLEAQDYTRAAETLRDFLAEHAEHELAVDAHFLLAEALVKGGEFLAAVDAYRAYLEERDVIEPYVQMWIGDAYTFAGAYTDAQDAYEQALAHAPMQDVIFQVREKMALAFGYAGDYATAMREYDAILAAVKDANLRARIQYQAAQTLLMDGESEAAYKRLYDLIANYYKTSAAYDALVDLINSSQPVDEFQRGRVDYYNEAYDAAVAAFYRDIESDLEGHVGAPHYYAGLAYRDDDNLAGALVEFDKLIDTHPGDPYEDDAWLAKAWTHYRAGDNDVAVATYTRFVAENPYNGLAPEALWWAANIRFWGGHYERAEPLFAQLVADYPSSEYASDAQYRAAFCQFQLQNLVEAEDGWRRYAANYPTADLTVGAHFWRGRALLAAGETISATAAFQQAVDAGPLDYYSQRALDYLAGPDADEGDGRSLSREPFLRREIDLSSRLADEAVEHAAADGWIAGWLGLDHTEAVTVSEPSSLLASDPRLQRGQELWRLGRRMEGREELEWLRRDTATDLRAQYELAIAFKELGLYRSSILAANAAILLSPARSPFDAPPFLARLAYPTYYADLVLPEAEANDLDPLLLFSLIRQESLFEGFATSYAFAYGLMQIIPNTGQYIASNLDWPDYETSDLYRPVVSVKFGSWYLARQRDTFRGLIYPALAAYNGGPGNALRWLYRTLTACSDQAELDEAAPGACPFDFDVFVEIVNLVETRLYIRQIYKHFAVYQHLYSEQ